jgi:hypothetical protein
MNAWIAIFTMGTQIVPFSDAQREPYVHELCAVARKEALPAGSSSTIALQSYAVCLLVFGDMIYAGNPLHSCKEVIARSRPADRSAAEKICTLAKSLTESWSGGRF